MLSPMMVERRWPTCISFAMLGEEKSTTTLDMAPKEHMNKRPLPHRVCMIWVLLGGAGGTRITSADPQLGISEASAWDLLQPSRGSEITPRLTWAQHPPPGSPHQVPHPPETTPSTGDLPHSPQFLSHIPHTLL